MPAGKKTGARKIDEKTKDMGTAPGTGSIRNAADKKPGELQQDSPGLTRQTPEQLVHELLVHQTELEMQAEELRRAHLELSESRDTFLDLYDFAPNGYLTLTDKALIKDVNLAGALLLGVERRKLAGVRFRKFIAPRDLASWDRYFNNLLTHGERQKCTLTLVRGDGSAFPARLESIRIAGSNGTITVRSAFSDITDIWQITAITESEERFRKIFENSPIGMALVKPDFRFFAVNPAWISMTGYSETELLKMSFPDITHPDHRAGDLEHIRELVAGTIPVYTTEKRYIRKDGSILWGLIRVTVILDQQGSLCYFAAQIEDISERKRVEAELAAAQLQYRELFENVSIGILRTTPGDGGAFIEANPAALRIFEAESREQFFAVRPVDLYADNGQRQKVSDEILAKGSIRDMEVQFKTLKGNPFWGKISSITKIASDGNTCFDTSIEDITLSRQAESALKENENRFRLLFERSPVPYQSLDASGHFLEVNDAWLATLGYARDEVIGHWFGDFIDPDFSEVFRTNFPKFKDAGETHVEFDMKRKGGARIQVIFDGKIGHYPDGSFRQTHCVFRDVTRERAAEEALRESEAKFRTLFESADDAIFIMNGTTFLDCNQSTLRIYGCTEDQILGHSPVEFSPQQQPDGKLSSEKAQEKITLALSGHPQSFEWVHHHADGTPFYAEVTLNRISLKDGDFLQAIVRDITERKRAEDALQESNRQLTTLIANLQGMVYRCRNDPAWTMEYASDGCTALTGYTPEEFVTDRTVAYGDLIHPDDRENVWNNVQAALAEHRPFELKYRITARDGTITWVWELGRGIFSPEGTLLALEGYNNDITAEQAATEALKKTHALLKETQEISRLGGWEYDVALGHIMWTDEVYRIHGVGLDFDPGRLSRDIQFYTQKDLPVISEAFRRCCELGEAYDLELEMIRADDRRIWVRTMGKAVREDDRIVRVHGNIIDITERKLAEDALRTSEEKYRLIAENTGDNIWIFDMDFRLKYISPSIEKLRGFSVEEAMALPLDQQMTPESLAALVKKFNEEMELDASGTADPSRTVSFETEEYCKDGSTIIVENSATLLRDADGRPHSILGISRDITERRHAEKHRENLIHELAQKNAELDRFTYTVSHDLKSPLLSIRAFASLLKDDLKSENTERVNLDIVRISESAEKLENLITTLLTLSRSGRSVDVPVRIPFADLTREAAALLDNLFQARGIRLEIPASMPDVQGDRQRLFQVMTNLLDNAVKFMGDQKEPLIEVSVRPDATLPVICVRDNGMGIKKENLEKVFGLYERFNPDIPGTGIGLATVKRIIEAHGGTIWVESEGEGKGTTICFTLPGFAGTDNNNNR